MSDIKRTIAILVALALPIPALAADGGEADAKVKADAMLVEKAAKPVEPETVEDALKVGKDAVAAARSGNWWLFSALGVTVLLFLIKLLGTKVGSWWAKLGRWRYVVPPVLSLAAALLAAFQGGVSVDAAVGVFTASWATSSLQELWEHGVLGKSRKGTSA